MIGFSHECPCLMPIDGIFFLCMGRSSDGRAKYDYRDMGKSIKIDDL